MKRLTDDELAAWKKRLNGYRLHGQYLGLADEALESAIAEIIEYRDAEAIAQAHAAEDPSRPVPAAKFYPSVDHANALLRESAAEHAALVAEGLPPIKPHELLATFRDAGCLYEREETPIPTLTKDQRGWLEALRDAIAVHKGPNGNEWITGEYPDIELQTLRLAQATIDYILGANGGEGEP